MKKKLRLLLSMVLTIVFCIVPVQVFADEISKITIEVPYEYPVLPGTDEWAEFYTRNQKVEACQIPEHLLTNMSTRALALTVLKYPLLNDYIAYDDHLLAAQNMEKEFNGYRELLTRTDINDVLLALYQESQVYPENKVDKFDGTSDELDRLYEFFLVPNIEFLISYSQVYGNSFSDEQQEIFLSELAKKNEARFNSNISSKISYEYINFWDSISDKNKIAKMDIVLPPQTLAGENGTLKNVYTPNGSSVEAIYNRSRELSSTEKDMGNSYMALHYPNATRISEPTVKYNCHSYAWYLVSSSNRYWIDEENSSEGPNLSKYWTDGSYHEVSSGTSTGIKVFYYNSDHSAIYQRRKIVNGAPTWIYRSKWGQCELYDYYLYDCPYPNSRVRYYARS